MSEEEPIEAPFEAEPMNVDNLASGLTVPGSAQVSCLDFHRSGEMLLAVSEDNLLHVLDSLEGKSRKKIYCKKHGVGLVRFTHHTQSILHSSRPAISTGDKEAHDIRYLSLYDNEYLRFYTGHVGRVTSLDMSYTDDMFLSGAVDGTVRLWTLQQCTPLGLCDIPNAAPNPTLVKFDPTGLVFAAAAYVDGRHIIKLYDAKKFSEGAFENFRMTDAEIEQTLLNLNLDPETSWSLSRAQWISLDFSQDGKNLVVCTNAGMALVIDAYVLQLRRVICGYSNATHKEIVGTLTPDAGHFLIGSDVGEVSIYDVRDKGWQLSEKPARLLSGHTGPVRQVICNPKYEVVASACHHTILWIAR